jgi:aconitate hydratase
MPPANPFNSRKTLTTSAGSFAYYDLGALVEQSVGHVDRLPYSIRVLLEAMLRNVDGFTVTQDDVVGLANWDAKKVNRVEMPFMPGRVVLQDFTGVPCVVDLAAMRDAMRQLGGDPAEINPAVQCDLVIDHSVQVDDFATRVALTINAEREFERNNERYTFLKWGQESLSNFSVVPPATGIVHQVNLEYLAQGVLTKEVDGQTVAYPDSLVGTDSHTTMINGLGVVGWGVGGIEAEAVMLGQPVYMLTPEVIGFRLRGKLPEGATATDLVLTVTQMLRARGVVEKFVEFFGDGLATLSLPDRATIANMAPEYGATMGFFPVDTVTLDYLRLSNRSEAQIELVEAYCRANRLFWTPDAPEPEYTDVLELDLSTVVPSLAGPKRPQDRVRLSDMRPEFHRALTAPVGPQGLGVDASKTGASVDVTLTEASHPAECDSCRIRPRAGRREFSPPRDLDALPIWRYADQLNVAVSTRNDTSCIFKLDTVAATASVAGGALDRDCGGICIGSERLNSRMVVGESTERDAVVISAAVAAASLPFDKDSTIKTLNRAGTDDATVSRASNSASPVNGDRSRIDADAGGTDVTVE